MELQCESCGDIFMSNTLLYKHKQIAHANLCNSSNSCASSITTERKRSSTDDNLKQSKLSKIESKSNVEDNSDYEVSYKVIDPTLKNEMGGEEIQIIDNQMDGKSCYVSTDTTDHKSSGAGRLSESKFQSVSKQATFKTEQLHDNDLIRIMESVYKTQIVQKLEHNIMNLRQKHKIEIAEIRQKYNDSCRRALHKSNLTNNETDKFATRHELPEFKVTILTVVSLTRDLSKVKKNVIRVETLAKSSLKL